MMSVRVVTVVLASYGVFAIFDVSAPVGNVGGACCAVAAAGEASCTCATIYPNYNTDAPVASHPTNDWTHGSCGGPGDYGYYTDFVAREWCNKPQSVCAVGYYQTELMTYTSCAGQSGNKIVGFAKESMTSAGGFNSFNMVLTLPQGLTNFYIRMIVYGTDLDMLVGHSNYLDANGKSCIVGRDCTFDRTATNPMYGCAPGMSNAPDSFDDIGGFCIDEDDFTNTEPSAGASTWYWSGASEGPRAGSASENEGFGAKTIKNRDYEIRVFAAQTGWGKLEYSFASISPCPTLPLPSSCADDPDVENEDTVEVTGDPHMRNINGEVFDLSAEGDHVLIQIPAGSGEELEVIGTVSAFQKMRKCPLFFLTNLKMQGSLVGDEPINILADEGSFGVKVSSSTEFLNLDFNTPLTIGAAKVEKCNEDNLFCKSTTPLRRTPSHANKFHVMLSSKLHVVASSYASANPSFINIAVSGLASHHDVGGLLGHDDHSHVTSDASCSTVKSSKRKTSMLQTVFDVESNTVGHLSV